MISMRLGMHLKILQLKISSNRINIGQSSIRNESINNNNKMRKVCFLIVAIIFIGMAVCAQDNNVDLRDNLLLGIKIGGNLSNVYDTKGDAFNANPKIGLAAGGFLSIPIIKYLGFQPELLFSQKGFRATGNFLDGTYNLTRTTNYIDIPLLIALKPSNQITLLVGPQYSYLLSQKDVFSNGSISIVDQQQFENNNVRKNIFCFLGGLDVTLNHMVIGARIGWDISDNNGDGTSSSPRYKNVWYQATLGYRF
jgi:Outer membrane protein beta-barrel domain